MLQYQLIFKKENLCKRQEPPHWLQKRPPGRIAEPLPDLGCPQTSADWRSPALTFTLGDGRPPVPRTDTGRRTAPSGARAPPAPARSTAGRTASPTRTSSRTATGRPAGESGAVRSARGPAGPEGPCPARGHGGANPGELTPGGTDSDGACHAPGSPPPCRTDSLLSPATEQGADPEDPPTREHSNARRDPKRPERARNRREGDAGARPVLQPARGGGGVGGDPGALRKQPRRAGGSSASALTLRGAGRGLP